MHHTVRVTPNPSTYPVTNIRANRLPHTPTNSQSLPLSRFLILSFFLSLCLSFSASHSPAGSGPAAQSPPRRREPVSAASSPAEPLHRGSRTDLWTNCPRTSPAVARSCSTSDVDSGGYGCYYDSSAYVMRRKVEMKPRNQLTVNDDNMQQEYRERRNKRATPCKG